MNKIFAKTFVILSAAYFFIIGCPVYSQQNIVTVPSSEVLPSGTIILKESTKVLPEKSVRLAPSVIVGLGKGFDFSLGIPATINFSNANTNLKTDIGLKKVFYAGPTTRLTMGAGISPYLNKTATPDTFAYVHATQRIKKTKTSLTVGAYFNGQKHLLNSSGVVLGVDQVIIPNKLRLACDWLSGDNNRSNLSVGIKYRPVPTVSMATAVIIPNNNECIGFQLSLSKFIQLNNNSIRRL